MSGIEIPAVCRNALHTSSTSIARIGARQAGAVFKTETGLVALRHLFPIHVKDVVVDECLEGVVMSVAIVPNPVLLVGNGYEILRTQVHGEAVEPKKFSDMVIRLAISTAGKALVIHSTLQVVHRQAINKWIVEERAFEVGETWYQVRKS